MGKTSDIFDTSSLEDFAKDVEAGIQYLLSRKDADASHIGLIGHSEGGMIAPLVAVRDKNISFIVLLAGPGVPGSVINDYQNAQPMENAGLDTAVVKKFLDLHHVLTKVAISFVNEDEYKNEISKVYDDWKKNQSPETLNALIKGTDEQVVASLQKKYFLFHSKWR